MATCTSNVAGEDYADFIHRHNNLSMEQLMEQFGTSCIEYVNTEYAIIHIPLQTAQPISIERDTYDAIPKLFALLDTTSMSASGILPVFEQPTLNLRGQGAMIGLIDTGIDYQNPIFRKADGTTRILGIWDQNIPGQPFSLPGLRSDFQFLTGTAYTADQINEALRSPDPLSIVPSTDTNGHGTFLAGIAGGGPTANQDFIGASPECSLAVVKLKPAKQYLRDFFLIREDAIAYQENDIMTAITYLTLVATQYQLPLTICIGLGTNQGSHDGTDPLSLRLSDLGRNLGVAAVCAAGNEVGYRNHFMGHFNPSMEYEEVELRVAPGEAGFTLELWATAPELYTVGFVSPTGEIIQRIPQILGNETLVTFRLEQTVITVNYRAQVGVSGNQLIFMRFQAPTPGIWRIRVYNTIFLNGIYHIWLPIHGFTSDDTVFLQADPYTTITGPGNAAFPITVSTYNHMNGSLFIHSSRGNTRNGLLKPDLAAPGVDVYGPGISTGTAPAPMVRMTGSSVAAAHVAGAVANLMSWGMNQGDDTVLNYRNIKSALIRGANRNPAYTYPNRKWGYGTLDLYQTFLAMRE